MKVECPLCKSDKFEIVPGNLWLGKLDTFKSTYICLSCGIHYSDVGEKGKAMTFELWYCDFKGGGEMRGEFSYDDMKQAYEAGQKSVK